MLMPRYKTGGRELSYIVLITFIILFTVAIKYDSVQSCFSFVKVLQRNILKQRKEFILFIDALQMFNNEFIIEIQLKWGKYKEKDRYLWWENTRMDIIASAFIRRHVCRIDRNWIYASESVRVPVHFAQWRNRFPRSWTGVDRNSMPIYNMLFLSFCFSLSPTCLASYRSAACTLVSRHEWKKEYWAKSHLASKETPPSGRVARPRANKSDFMNDEFRKCLKKKRRTKTRSAFQVSPVPTVSFESELDAIPRTQEMIKGEERARRKRKDEGGGQEKSGLNMQGVCWVSGRLHRSNCGNAHSLGPFDSTATTWTQRHLTSELRKA